jgi:hypothetical protein
LLSKLNHVTNMIWPISSPCTLVKIKISFILHFGEKTGTTEYFLKKKKNWRKWLFLKKQFLKEWCEMKKKTKNFNKPMLDGQDSRQYEDLLPQNFLRDA